jgi:phosphoglycolate phosphatase
VRIAARAVLIDLDGTLLDTVPDLAAAVNAMRREFQLPELPEERVAAFVGKGADVLVQRALTGELDGEAGEQAFARGREAFYRHYRHFNGRAARVYPGVVDALADLRAKALPLACVTNKPREFTLALLERVGLLPSFGAIVAGDDTTCKKPDAEPMLLACRQLAVNPRESVAIGDSANDVAAARAAGCRVIVVETGYNEGMPASELDADVIVPTLLDAARLIGPIDVDRATPRRSPERPSS